MCVYSIFIVRACCGECHGSAKNPPVHQLTGGNSLFQSGHSFPFKESSQKRLNAGLPLLAFVCGCLLTPNFTVLKSSYHKLYGFWCDLVMYVCMAIFLFKKEMILCRCHFKLALLSLCVLCIYAAMLHLTEWHFLAHSIYMYVCMFLCM